MPLAIQCYFFRIKISPFQLKNRTFREGESSGGPEYMVHVSGDGVELLKGGESTGDSHRQPHYMLAKIGTDSGGITWWSNFELLQVEPHTIGQIWNLCKWHSI